jgi:MFS family permease
MFFANGAVFANWLTRIPQFQQQLDLSKSALGVTLMAGSAGTIGALAITSGLIGRFGSRAMTLAGTVALCATFFLVALMPHPIAFAAALCLFGVAMTMMDVSMNTQAAEVERRCGRPIMSSFHAAWSFGGFAGAGMGAGMVSLSTTPTVHFSFAAVLFLGLGLAAGRNLPHVEHETRGDEPVFQLPPASLLPIGLVALCAGIAEGSMGDWGAIYLHDVVRTSEEVAALGYTAFSIAMAAGRLSGDWLAVRLAPALLVRIGGAVAALGLLAASFVPLVPIVMIGFAAVGIGLANAIPLAFSAGGNVPGITPSRGIAGVATIGYAGFLVGPPFIGLVADATSLRVSLGLVAALAASIMFLGRAMRRAGGLDSGGRPASPGD